MVYGLASGAEYSTADEGDYRRREHGWAPASARTGGRRPPRNGVAATTRDTDTGGTRPEGVVAPQERGGADAGAGTSTAAAPTPGRATGGCAGAGDPGVDETSSDEGFHKLKPAPEGRTRLTLTSKQLLSSTYKPKEKPLYYTAPTVPLEPPAVLRTRPQSAVAGKRVSVGGTAAPLEVSPVKGRRGSAPAWSATRVVQASKSVQAGPPRYVASSGTQTQGWDGSHPGSHAAAASPSPAPSAASSDMGAAAVPRSSPAAIHSIVTRGAGPSPLSPPALPAHGASFRTTHSVLSDVTGVTFVSTATVAAAPTQQGWAVRAKGPAAELWPGMHEQDSLLPAVDMWLSQHNVGSLPANTVGMASARKLRGTSMRSPSVRGAAMSGAGFGSVQSDDSEGRGANGAGLDDFGNEDGAGDAEDALAVLRQREFEAFNDVEPYSDPLVALRPSKRLLTRARTSISQCTRAQLRRFVEVTPEKRVLRILRPVRVLDHALLRVRCRWSHGGWCDTHGRAHRCSCCWVRRLLSRTW